MSDLSSDLTKGCTGLSFILGKLGIVLKEERCCEEHDEAYINGGSWCDKVVADYKLMKCVIRTNGKVKGAVKSVVGMIALSVLPYPYRAFNHRTQG